MEELGRQGREGSGTPGDKHRGEEPPEIVVKEVAECGNGKRVKNASTNGVETRGGKGSWRVVLWLLKRELHTLKWDKVGSS